MNRDPFPVDALIEHIAAEAHEEIKLMAVLAREAIDERFRHVNAFVNRSIAQRKRFARVRALQEKAT